MNKKNKFLIFISIQVSEQKVEGFKVAGVSNMNHKCIIFRDWEGFIVFYVEKINNTIPIIFSFLLNIFLIFAHKQNTNNV